MTRFPLVSLLVAAASSFGLCRLVAEERAPVSKEPPPAETAAPAPARPRLVSPEMAENLAAMAPKFTPPDPATAKPVDPQPDLRETDKPRNTIIRLPRYIVEEPKIRLPKEREMLTPKGRVALALKRHPGLNFGPFAFLNIGAGLAMLEEEERLERMAEANDLLGLLRIGNDESYKKLKSTMDQSFIRHDE